MTTYALIHGGGYSSTCWERVTPHLDGDVILVELPGRGRRPADLSTVTLADNVAATIEDLGDADDVVLVAHSVAGITAAHVLKEAPGLVRDVVLVSCTIPPHGSAVIDHIDPGVRDSVMAGTGNGVFRIDDETCRRILCNDLDEASCQWILDIRCDETTSVLGTPVDLHGFADVPVTYVRLLLDQTLPLEQQDRAIAAVGAVRPPEVVELEAGHMAMVSRPRELAAIINTRRG
jgi:pimeloyl-ACP methyl ester carboxylesterase